MPTSPVASLTVTLLVAAQFAGIATAQLRFAPPQTDKSLRAPQRILAAGKPVDVTTGHAAPYVMDWDSDGKRDLLVGEFGDGRFENEDLPEGIGKAWIEKGRFANGRVRIYKNHGTNTAPRFEKFEYLRAGGGIASVPIT